MSDSAASALLDREAKEDERFISRCDRLRREVTAEITLEGRGVVELYRNGEFVTDAFLTSDAGDKIDVQTWIDDEIAKMAGDDRLFQD